MSSAIIEKCRKLFTLANNDGATEGERDNALRMAYGLMAKHNLDETMLDSEDLRQILEVEAPGAAWIRQVTNSVAGLFFCTLF